MSGEDELGIRPIHTAIVGRARLEIPGLKGSPELKRHLESHRQVGVNQLSANTKTGRVLVFFEAEISLGEVIDGLALLLTGGHAETPIGSEPSWAGLEFEELWSDLTLHPSGLSEQEARERLESAGPNQIAVIPRRSRREILLGQFQNLPVALLGASALISLLTGGLFDALVILGVVGLNAGIGLGTEVFADETISALSDGPEGSGFVVRNGVLHEVPLGDIVPGDVIELKEGLIVPADARLLVSDGLTISEAILTGESVPVEKHSAAVTKHAPIEHQNNVFRGTLVTGGTGRAIVFATGQNTQIGLIQSSINEASRPRTPLQQQLDVLGRQLVAVSLAASALVFFAGTLRGQRLFPMLKIAGSLAIAAVPEGLPTLATTTLAIGIARLRRQGVLIRRLPAVEGLSSVQLICFDKTGTLTRNRMAVTEIVTPMKRWSITGRPIVSPGNGPSKADKTSFGRLLEICSLCNDASADGQGPGGSSTESALVEAATAVGIDVTALRIANPRLEVVQRSEQRRYMATKHASDDERRLIAVKGDPDRVLALSGWIDDGGRLRKLGKKLRARIANDNEQLAATGLRVLGVAHQMKAEEDPQSLVWDGLIAMADPVRPEAARIIQTFHRAGIGTMMITGDQAATATSIAQEVGLCKGPAPPLIQLRESFEAPHATAGSHVFSRVTPSQKLRIIQSLQAAGFIVAMTGDGVNDAPSLRTADIGIALAGGTEAARQTADLVLLGDQLNGLVVAIENGRNTYNNIQRAIEYLLATNLSEIALTLIDTATGIAAPLTPLQLLWVNLVTDVLPALGLALESPSEDLMGRPPRNPKELVIPRPVRSRLVRDGIVITGTTLLAQIYARLRYGNTPAAGAVGFTSLVSSQLLHAFRYRNARRHETDGGFDYLAGSLAISAGVQACGLFVPGLRRMVGGPIDALDLVVAAASGIASLAVTQAVGRTSQAQPRPARGG